MYTPIKFDVVEWQVVEAAPVCGMTYEAALQYAVKSYGEEWAATREDESGEIEL